jgi:glycosyltransferase involved in cell wall biosynthesis
MENPLVSIIIPTFNRAAIIVKALDSVLAQSYSHWECLVVDDGSNDETFKVMKSYQEKDSRIQFYKRHRAPKGAPTCRNIGLTHAQGDYVVYLDSDDYLLAFCLEQRVKAFNTYANHHFLVFPMGKQKETAIIKQEIPEYEDYRIPFLSANLPWSIMCPIWKRTFLLTLKGFTEGYPRFNDPDLMIRALLDNNVSFKVLQDFKFDTVYVPDPKESPVFINKVFESLQLFIPDVATHLEQKDKSDYKRYLTLYLHLWFKYFYIPSGTSRLKPSIVLILMFKSHGIISNLKMVSLLLRLLLYWTSKQILRQPINKLSDKALYQ